MILGALITWAVNSVRPLLVNNDALLAPYEKYIHPIVLVLTFFTSALDAGAQGHLSQVSLASVSAFLNTYVPMLISAKATSVVVTPAAPKTSGV